MFAHPMTLPAPRSPGHGRGACRFRIELCIVVVAQWMLDLGPVPVIGKGSRAVNSSCLWPRPVRFAGEESLAAVADPAGAPELIVLLQNRFPEESL
jgi:hypothetical protein